MALGPEKWQPRSGLGWEFDHFIGYFVITTFICLAWPRPLVVGAALMAFGSLLEGLQAFTPDRSSNLMAAIYGAMPEWWALRWFAGSNQSRALF